MTNTDKMQLMFGLSALLTERNAALRELDAVRAELREAMELLGQVNENYTPNGSWFFDREVLLAKHKEPNQ